MRSRDRIANLELRQYGETASIHEIDAPLYTDWDPQRENPIISAAQTCSTCPLKNECNPTFSSQPKGVSRILSLVVTGKNITSKGCLLRAGTLLVEARGSDFRNQLLKQLTEQNVADSKKTYRLKLSA